MYGPRTQLGNRGRKSACREASRDDSIVDTREELMTTEPAISVNERAAKLVARLIADAAELRVGVCRGELGETLIDSGSRNIGSVAAGLRIAEICTGGLASVRLAPSASTPRWPWMILVQSSQPVLACLASQYAGWRLSSKERGKSFVALGSGPARALARREPLFDVLAYADSAANAVLVIESNEPPPANVVAQVAQDCHVEPENITIIFAPTQSLAGGTQIVARSLEVALHKAHELHFPLERVVDGIGAAPLCPPHPDFVTAMGRTNDAIIFAGQVQLFVTGPASEARSLANQLSSKASRDYGRPFAEIFKAVKGDFYAIDPMLFSPAMVIVTALETGETFQSGHIDLGLLNASFA
jgi:methenyltetrahydromethanopterin cyclohydrolase